MNISLFFNLNCQLDCSHCLVDAGHHQEGELDRDGIMDVFRKLRDIKAASRDNEGFVSVNITGGEPTLISTDLLKFSIDVIRRYFPETEPGIKFTTNLIGYSEEFGKMVTDYKVDIETSFDPVIRTLNGDHGGFKDVWQGKYKQAKEAGLKIPVIFTATSYLLNGFDLAGFMEENSIETVRVDALLFTGRGRKLADVCGVTRKEYSEYMIKMEKELGDRLQPVASLKTLLKNPDLWKQKREDCWGERFKDSYVIYPDGTIGNCKMHWGEENGTYGNVFSNEAKEIISSKPRSVSISQKLMSSLSKECSVCSYQNFCLGGCTCKEQLMPGDGECSGFKTFLCHLGEKI